MVRQAHRKFKIYTKTGDKGETSLFGGKRVSKSNIRVEAYGSVDELNSLIGVIISQNQKSPIRQAQGKNQKYNAKVKNELKNIQKDLFEIGANLASLAYSSSGAKRSREVLKRDSSRQARTIKSLEKRVIKFEQMTDELSEELPEVKNFILPGGGEVGSLFHFARTVCRRAERRVVELSKKEEIESPILVYLNRLSDLLFVMARFINHKEKKKEIIWNKNR